MRTLVVYSSLTGNTKKVGEAIASGLPAGTEAVSIKEVPADLADYDCVFIGFWVDRGTADKATAELLPRLTNKHVALFATLGANPKSPHAAESLDKAAALLPEGKTPIARFICQGAVDPKVIEMMYKQFPKGHVHGQSPERDALHAQAATHPDEADLTAAKKFAEETMAKIS